MANRVVPDRQGVINIGKIKENLVTEVELPAPGFEGGSYAVLLQRPREKQPYPVTARTEGGRLIWTVQAADTAIAGTGKLECRWYGDNGEVAKSQTYMVRITDGLPDPTEAPEAWEGFMGQVARNAQAAQTAAGEAKANADGAAASAGIAQGAAAEAGKFARAAGEAANAAAAAASAASSAQAGAETAGQNARAAAEAAETARSGAEAAKLAAGESATAAAGSAEAAAQAAQKGQALYDQVKDDLAAGKLKGEKGDPGKDAPQIDDSVVSAQNPWSSRKIVETLCPPISESGNPVTCEPVAGYPLGVAASWEPIQAGTGEPSPENIRPIKGRDSVAVERCGENVIEFLSTNDSSQSIKIAVDSEKNITLNGTVVEKNNIVIGMCRLHWVAGKTYTMYVKKVGGSVSLGSVGDITFAYSLFTTDYNHYFRGDTNSTNLDAYIASNAALAETELAFMLQCWRVNTVFNNFKFQIEVVEGTTAPTIYTPYRGDKLTLALPSTIYGGSLDAVMGDGTETWKLVTLDGTENWETWGVNKINAAVTGFYTYSINDFDPNGDKLLCSMMPFKNVEVWGGRNEGIGFGRALNQSSRYIIYSVKTDTLSDASDNASAVASFKAFLAAKYAAGTPVQIAYKLATPPPITATGNAEIMPIPGETNTVMTDADSVAVTGRADPIRIIQQLQAQLATATQQLDETQQEVVDTAAMTVDYIYQQDLEDIGLEEVDDSDNQTDTEPVDVP